VNALQWRSYFLLFCLAFVGSAPAFQESNPLPTVKDPIPTIAFPDWRHVSEEDDDENVVEYSVSFPSAFRSIYPENSIVPLTVFLPAERKGPIPVVVILHYLGARDLRAERRMGKEFAQKGLGSVILTLPFHLQRTPAGHSSGELAIRPDPDHLIAMMTQSTLDVRRTVDWIFTRPEFDSNHIGITGISLGALVASLSYAVEPRFNRAALILGGVDLAHILWNSSIVVSDREKLRRLGYTESTLREKLASVEPQKLLEERKSGRAFVIGARYDSVIPRIDVEKMIAALGTPQTLWIDTGHYGGIFVQNRVTRLVAEFFQKEFGGVEFVSPHAIYAPTIRIGAQADFEDGFEIALGLDLLRSGHRGDAFASFLVSPRTPSLFLGYHISGGLAPGIVLTTDHVTLGVYWSFVL
jgi:dienelactone hydrolase